MARQGSEAKLADLERRLKHLQEMNVSIAYQNALIDHEEQIIELLQQQMIAGVSGDNDSIRLDGLAEYHPSTIRYKLAFGQGLGKIVDRIVLYMFGDFYAQMYTTIKGETFSIKSKVPYYDNIITRTGPNVMKLSPESMETLLNLWINPIIKEVVSEHLRP